MSTRNVTLRRKKTVGVKIQPGPNLHPGGPGYIISLDFLSRRRLCDDRSSMMIIGDGGDDDDDDDDDDNEYGDDDIVVGNDEH